MHFFHEKIPSRFVFLSPSLRGSIYLESAGSSQNLLRLAYLMNSSKLFLNASSFFVLEASSALSGMSIPLLLRTSPMRLRRPGLYAKPVPSIAMPIMLYRAINRKVIGGKKMARKSRTGKRLRTELVTRMEAVMPPKPKRLQPTHLFFLMLQSPSSRSCSSYAPWPIFKMPST